MSNELKPSEQEVFKIETGSLSEDSEQPPSQAHGGKLPVKAQAQSVQKDEDDSATRHLAKPRLDKLVISQLASSLPDWLSDTDKVDGAVQLYLNFNPASAEEELLARLAVGITNASMDGIDRANRAGLYPEVRHMELKLAHKGSAAVVEVLKMLQAQRGPGDQKINVGSVNIGSGGKAIVGNIKTTVQDEEEDDR